MISRPSRACLALAIAACGPEVRSIGLPASTTVLVAAYDPPRFDVKLWPWADAPVLKTLSDSVYVGLYESNVAALIQDPCLQLAPDSFFAVREGALEATEFPPALADQIRGEAQCDSCRELSFETLGGISDRIPEGAARFGDATIVVARDAPLVRIEGNDVSRLTGCTGRWWAVDGSGDDLVLGGDDLVARAKLDGSLCTITSSRSLGLPGSNVKWVRRSGERLAVLTSSGWLIGFDRDLAELGRVRLPFHPGEEEADGGLDFLPDGSVIASAGSHDLIEWNPPSSRWVRVSLEARVQAIEVLEGVGTVVGDELGNLAIRGPNGADFEAAGRPAEDDLGAFLPFDRGFVVTASGGRFRQVLSTRQFCSPLDVPGARNTGAPRAAVIEPGGAILAADVLKSGAPIRVRLR
ncbi:MAG: hypothetical protein HYV07_33625 [Deltaproteobacteria bacterium]|nr:hypothetical protein [Deltaproteobacteria bacterium]